MLVVDSYWGVIRKKLTANPMTVFQQTLHILFCSKTVISGHGSTVHLDQCPDLPHPLDGDEFPFHQITISFHMGDDRLVTEAQDLSDRIADIFFLRIGFEFHQYTIGSSQGDDLPLLIDRAAKYYADIERGSCGMSVETLMALSETLDMSLDYIIYGKNTEENGYPEQTAEVSAILTMLNNSGQRERDYALRLLKLFLASRK